MRNKVLLKSMKVRDSTYNDLKKFKKYFQKKLGGGVWSFSDTIDELLVELKV